MNAQSYSVETSYGALRGEDFGDVTVYRGVPYARPPLNELRFAAPEPLSPWQGVRDATLYGPAAMQAKPQGSTFGMFGPGGREISEDCLYLNVWVPNTATPDKPVMVWIHGGIFRMGTGGSPTYEASRLAAYGDVIVVTINYRLGCFGFLHAPGEATSNAGLLDQLAALNWISAEIGAFGGNPDNVTLFGESAGAKSIECLMASPRASGLFHRGILQSTYRLDMNPETAIQTTQRLLDAAGVDSVDGLIRMDAEALQGAHQAMTVGVTAGQNPAGFCPVIDGDLLPVDTLDAIREGTGAPLPAIIGTNRDEMRLFGMMDMQSGLESEKLMARLKAQNPQMPEQKLHGVIESYTEARRTRDEPVEPLDVWFDLATDKLFRMHSIELAETLALAAPVRTYRFDWKSQAFNGALGALHGLEMAFTFRNMEEEMGKIAGPGPEATHLCDIMQTFWTRFAHGENLSDWPLYEPGGRLTMIFGKDSRVEAAPQEAERLAFLACFSG